MNGHNATAAPAIQVLQPTDHIDIGSAPQLKADLQALLRRGSTRVVIDLARVQYVDSAGLSALVAIARAFAAAGGTLRLCNPQPDVGRALALTRLDALLPLSAGLDEARAALAETPA